MTAGKSSSYCGRSYDGGMAILNEGVKNGQIHVLTYDTSNCGGEICDLDVESGFEDILDKLGYARELVYSENSMRVWFGIYTEKSQDLVDDVMKEIRDIDYLSGISVTISQQTLVV